MMGIMVLQIVVAYNSTMAPFRPKITTEHFPVKCNIQHHYVIKLEVPEIALDT